MELIFGVAGAAIGSVWGQPMTGWAIGTVLGGAVTALTTRTPEQQVGRLDSLQVSVSSNGAPIPSIYGRMMVPGNIIWSTDLQEVTQRQGGGKGRPAVTRFEYRVNCAVLVCKGTISQIVRIWADDEIIFDVNESPETRETIRIYSGEELIYPTVDDQDQDPLIVAAEGADNTPAYLGRAYVVFENLNVTPYGNRIPNFRFEVEQDTNTTLGEIVSGIAQAAGLETGQLNTSAGTDVIGGYIVGGRQPARSVIEPLLQAFAADLIEVDGLLKIVKRGGSSVATVSESELGASSGGQPGTRWQARRTPEIELPARYDLAYYTQDKQYQQGLQSAIRHTKSEAVQDAATLNLSAAIPDDDARQIAERLLYTAWRERESIRLLLPPKYAFCTPADVLTVPLDGVTRRLRIEQMDMNLLAEIAVTCVPDDTDVLTQVASGAVQTASSPSRLAAVPTTFRVFSGIELQDNDATQAGFYVVANGPTGWEGGNIYWSPDSGTTWINAGYIATRSAIGEADTTLAAWSSPPGQDTSNDVEVTLDIGSLSSVSDLEAEYGANIAVLGNEVIQPATATLLSGSSYELSDIWRRQRGTSGTGHTSSDRFFTVENAVRVTVPEALIGETLDVKVVSPYQTLADVTAQTVTIAAPSGQPWTTPDDVDAAIDAAAAGLWPGLGRVLSGSGPFTLEPDDNGVYVAIGGSIPVDDSIYLPLRSEARGPIYIQIGDDTFITLKRASGSSDTLDKVDVDAGSVTNATSHTFGDGSATRTVSCWPAKGDTTLWIVSIED